MRKALEQGCKSIKMGGNADSRGNGRHPHHRAYEAGKSNDWLRLPIGERFSARAAIDGCRVWIKKGHLRHVQAEQPTG